MLIFSPATLYSTVEVYISVLEVAVFEVVGKNFYPASRVVWSLISKWVETN
jgi:hypothetical protein